MVCWSKVVLSEKKVDWYLSGILIHKNYTWFEQPIDHKSVPEIFYVLVFVNQPKLTDQKL